MGVCAFPGLKDETWGTRRDLGHPASRRREFGGGKRIFLGQYGNSFLARNGLSQGRTWAEERISSPSGPVKAARQLKRLVKAYIVEPLRELAAPGLPAPRPLICTRTCCSMASNHPRRK